MAARHHCHQSHEPFTPYTPSQGHDAIGEEQEGADALARHAPAKTAKDIPGRNRPMCSEAYVKGPNSALPSKRG